MDAGWLSFAIVARLRPSPWPWRGPNQAKVTRADYNHCLVTTLKYPPAYSTGSRYWRPSPILITKRHWVMSLCLLPYKVTWYQSHELFDPVPVFELSALWSDYHPPSRLFPHCHHPPSEFLAKEKPASVSPTALLPVSPPSLAVVLMSRGTLYWWLTQGGPSWTPLQDVAIRPRPDTSSLSPSTPPHWTPTISSWDNIPESKFIAGKIEI